MFKTLAFATTLLYSRDQFKAYCSQVYAWGYANFGQLGLGNSNNQFLPQSIQTLNSKNIISISCKASVSAAVSADGKIYTWGRSKGGVLGHDNETDNNINIPTPLPLEAKFVKVSTGNNHMAAITQDGDLYTWGYDNCNPEHGKLGHSYQIEEKKVGKDHYNTKRNLHRGVLPQKVQIEDKIVQVACGAQHTICLTDRGEVLIWGLNKKGLLGLGVKDNEVVQPLKLNLGKQVKKIDAGSDFSFALTTEGQQGKSSQLYSWGSNYFGQLGTASPLSIDKPFEVKGFQSSIKDFSCGEQFAGAIDRDGKLYMWGIQNNLHLIQIGYGSDGQLGQSQRQDIPMPTMVNFPHAIKNLSCGIGHVGLVTSNGQLYMFGRGKEVKKRSQGQLGRGDEIESANAYKQYPALVEYLKKFKVLSIACGGSHTLAIIE